MAKLNDTIVQEPGVSPKGSANIEGDVRDERQEIDPAPHGNPTPPQDDINSSSKPKSEGDITKLTREIDVLSLSTQASLNEFTPPEPIKRVADFLKSRQYKNIVILTGAGVSCNAGIPDFRTPGTGLYDNLSKYNLPYPEAVFDLNFYRRNPAPFVQLASELWPGLTHSPTITHSFIALLERKGMLLRNYTQNIDMLDILAGVSEEKTVECHGHFRTASCTSCRISFDGDECKRIIVNEKRAPACHHCGGNVKPDIVFFGEQLPKRFHQLVSHDMKTADLMFVMGTSLQVAPVSLLPDKARRDCPRILFNRELCGTFLNRNGTKTRSRSYDTSGLDIFQKGDCDESIRILCKLLNWEDELNELNSSTRVC